MSSSQQGQVGTNQTSAGPNSNYFISVNKPVNGNLNMNGNNIDNVASLDNGVSSIVLNSPLNMNSNIISGVHDIILNSTSLDNELIIEASGALPQSNGIIRFNCKNASNQAYTIFGANCGSGGGITDSAFQLFSTNNSSTPGVEVLQISPQTNLVSTPSMIFRGAVEMYKLNITTGSNYPIGVGTVGTVANTSVTASSIILVNYAVAGARTLPLNVTAKSAGVNFTVTGDAGATFNYLIIN